MEEKTMSEVMDDTANNPLLEFSIKLCAAVKKEKCLHDHTSVRKYTTPDIEAAWDRVAKECKETIEYCKYRWKSMYKSFFRNYKRLNHYYLHDHMLFLQEGDQQDTLNDDTISTDKFNDDVSRQESEFDATQLDEDVGSESDTASADEIKNKRKFRIFLGEENENEKDAEDSEYFGKRKRLNHKRACKRGLDPKLVSELADDDDLEEKRPRRSMEKSKSLTHLKEKGQGFKGEIRSIKFKPINKNLYPETEETKKESLKAFNMSDSLKMVDTSTSTDIQYHHSSTQYEPFESSLNQLDEMFLNTLRNQLSNMNGRQKMHFKSKIYQSLMEVFDDAADFPNSKDIIKLQAKGAPLLVNTTTGELRLMRELVSLVQAAKSTPEIIKAKEKVKTPVNARMNSSNEASETANNSVISDIPSPSLEDIEDMDLQLSTEILEEEDDATLPRSLDEIMAKPGENRESIRGNNVIGLPKHVLQKVVRAAGSNGSTIVARDGDKRRIYRIYPKSINQLDGGGRLMVSKNPNSVGTFYVAPSKQVASANNAALSKTSNTSPSISVKHFANKTAHVSNAYPVSAGQNVVCNTTKRMKSPALYNSIHPANRILNASTGLFQEGSNGSTASSPPNTANISSGKTTHHSNTANPRIVSIQSSMQPPNTNAVPGHPSKKPIQARPPPQSAQIIQRRFSICGPLSTDQPNNSLPNLMPAPGKTVKPSHSSHQIIISKPVSLNKLAYNAESNKSMNKNASDRLEDPARPNNTKNKEFDDCKRTEAISSKVQEELPIAETAGTITADSLDPLYVKQTPIKSEPIDD